jgi:hypothetical protein
MLGRRFLILVAVLMGMAALAASLAPRQPATERERSEASPTPAPGSSTTLATVVKEVTTSEADVTVNEGDLVELTISGPERDSVMLLDRMRTIDPESPARFSLLAGKPGEYPIELVEADRQIGTLVIR